MTYLTGPRPESLIGNLLNFFSRAEKQDRRSPLHPPEAAAAIAASCHPPPAAAPAPGPAFSCRNNKTSCSPEVETSCPVESLWISKATFGHWNPLQQRRQLSSMYAWLLRVPPSSPPPPPPPTSPPSSFLPLSIDAHSHPLNPPHPLQSRADDDVDLNQLLPKK